MACDPQGSIRKGCGWLSQLPLTGSCSPMPSPYFKAQLVPLAQWGYKLRCLISCSLSPTSTLSLCWRWPVTITQESRGGKEDAHTLIYT